MKLWFWLFSSVCFVATGFASEPHRWTYLERGDSIHVIAPGYGANDGSVSRAKENIQKFGYTPEIPDDLMNPHPLGYSNTEEYRANHVKNILSLENSKVIWALRGGRGSSSLLPYLKDITPVSSPKLIVGYSDMTALHLWANQRGWPSLHSIVLGYNKSANADVVNKESLIEEVMNILSGKMKEVEYKVFSLNRVSKGEEINIKGSVVGGNLSLIQRSIGTETSLNAAGKILFLEDVGEQATRTYEALTHLDRAGVLNGIKALMFGNFTAGLKDEEVGKYKILMENFADRMNQRNIPVTPCASFMKQP